MALPLEHLFREGVKAEHFNRHKLGRTLEQCFNFGCESLFYWCHNKLMNLKMLIKIQFP
ncbi:MAG: DUF4277 domain-containing protein [Colwellia sp.]|nr:DUF4277 domain-containing protein [Colwellia sp.]